MITQEQVFQKCCFSDSNILQQGTDANTWGPIQETGAASLFFEIFESHFLSFVQKYLGGEARTRMASRLNITETQVKLFALSYKFFEETTC